MIAGAPEMSDMVTTLATRTGIDLETAKKGLGALLSFAKERLGHDTFSKVQSSVPGSGEMLSSFESSGESSGAGLLGTVSGLAGNLLGGKAGEGADLLAMLSRAGLDHNQVMAFLPRAFEMLRQYLPPEILEKVKGLLPAGVEGSPGTGTE
jgi:Protein of unknown function VcgC/VcgE (DUF2780)